MSGYVGLTLVITLSVLRCPLMWCKGYIDAADKPVRCRVSLKGRRQRCDDCRPHNDKYRSRVSQARYRQRKNVERVGLADQVAALQDTVTEQGAAIEALRSEVRGFRSLLVDIEASRRRWWRLGRRRRPKQLDLPPG